VVGAGRDLCGSSSPFAVCRHALRDFCASVRNASSIPRGPRKRNQDLKNYIRIFKKRWEGKPSRNPPGKATPSCPRGPAPRRGGSAHGSCTHGPEGCRGGGDDAGSLAEMRGPGGGCGAPSRDARGDAGPGGAMRGGMRGPGGAMRGGMRGPGGAMRGGMRGSERGCAARDSPPELAQGLAELGVVQMRVLVGQLPAGGLRPHHEGVHGPLDVRLGLERSVAADGHGHQAPVVALQHLRDGVADAGGEALVHLGRVHLGAQRSGAGRARGGCGGAAQTLGAGGGERRVRVRVDVGHGAGGARGAARSLQRFVVLLGHVEHGEEGGEGQSRPGGEDGARGEAAGAAHPFRGHPKSEENRFKKIKKENKKAKKNKKAQPRKISRERNKKRRK